MGMNSMAGQACQDDRHAGIMVRKSTPEQSTPILFIFKNNYFKFGKATKALQVFCVSIGQIYLLNYQMIRAGEPIPSGICGEIPEPYASHFGL